MNDLLIKRSLYAVQKSVHGNLTAVTGSEPERAQSTQRSEHSKALLGDAWAGLQVQNAEIGQVRGDERENTRIERA